MLILYASACGCKMVVCLSWDPEGDMYTPRVQKDLFISILGAVRVYLIDQK